MIECLLMTDILWLGSLSQIHMTILHSGKFELSKGRDDIQDIPERRRDPYGRPWEFRHPQQQTLL